MNIFLSEEKQAEIARQAFGSGLGVRSMTNYIVEIVDAALFEEPQRDYLVI